MALQLRGGHTSGFGKIILASFLVLALVAQPLYGMVAGQVANAIAATNTVYVSTTGSDSNDGGSLAQAYATIQKGLDEVPENGTVLVADGDYYGTANIKQNGTTLQGITTSRDKVFLHVSPTSGQAGIFASSISNVTIKNFGVYGDVFGSSGALIKLYNGSNARIENVAVKNGTATGINVNSYENVLITNSYIANVTKDGVSVVAKQAGSPAPSFVSKNVTIRDSAISLNSAGWSAIALYTASGVESENLENITISNVGTQYGARGIYVEGLTGKTVTSTGSDKLILTNVTVGQNTGQYINNASTNDVDASTLKVNVGGGVVVPVSSMTNVQYSAFRSKIIDHATNSSLGYVLASNDVVAPEVGLTAPTGVTNANSVEVKGWATDDNMRYYACYITTNQTITAFGREWTSGEPKSGSANDQSLADSACVTTWTTTSVGDSSNPVTLGSFDVSGLPDGSYTIHVHAHDVMGNQNEATTVFTIDRTAPVVSLNIANSSITTAQNATFSGTVDDLAVTEAELWIDGVLADDPVVVTNGEFSFAVTGLTVGTHSVVVKAKDAAGNEGSATQSVVVAQAPAAPSLITNDPTLQASTADDGETLPTDTPAQIFTVPIVGVLGAQDGTQNTTQNRSANTGSSTDADSPAVEGASDEKDGTFSPLGFAWYWWLVALAAVAGLLWLLAALRRRKDEE